MGNNKSLIKHCLVVTTLILSLLIPIHISADIGDEVIIAEGNYGIDWRLTGDGKLFLGEGELRPREGVGFNKTYPWSDNRAIIRYVIIEGEIVLPDSPQLFRGFSNLIGIENIDLLNTSNITDMSYMFYDASKLKTLDLSEWDMSNVIDMGSMFSRMTGLNSIELQNWDVSNVNYMNRLFYNAINLESLDLSSWDVSNVIGMSLMFGNDFANPSKLNNLKISTWDTSNVTNMSGMFSYAKHLTSIDLSNWDVSKVTNMSNMFNNASSLSLLDLSSWDTSNVENMSYMFQHTNLASLDLSSWNVSKVARMTNMFESSRWVYPFENLDLSNWILSGITDIEGLFQRRYVGEGVRAEYLNLSNWNIDKVYNLEALELIDYVGALDLTNWEITEEVDSLIESLFNKFPNIEIIGIDFEPSIERLSGFNRHSTSVEISKKAYKEADTVILANGYNYPDALVGGPLAAELDASILLIQENSIPKVVSDEIERLGASNIILLGGPRVISEDVQRELEENYTVSRLKGSNRFETAVEIGNRLMKTSQSKTAMLVVNNNYPDALGVSSPSGRGGNPVLFTTKDSLHNASKEALENWGIETVNIIGGPAVISEKVADELRAEGYTVDRFSGTNRELTALDIANRMFEDPDTIVLANGYNFPDALAGSPLAAKENAPLLLTNVNRINDRVLDFIRENSISKVYILGGPAVVSDEILEQLEKVVDK